MYFLFFSFVAKLKHARHDYHFTLVRCQGNIILSLDEKNPAQLLLSSLPPLKGKPELYAIINDGRNEFIREITSSDHIRGVLSVDHVRSSLQPGHTIRVTNSAKIIYR